MLVDISEKVYLTRCVDNGFFSYKTYKKAQYIVIV